ncbi:MAG: aminopeptidase P family protein [Ignavibacteria bacterium]|nr:aminopeptidase P family protein [Ignavibacteria bacterium]
MNLDQIQAALREQKIAGWLLCDFRNRDPLAYRVLGLDFTEMNSRRWYYWIPAKGEPRKLVHSVEKQKLDALPGKKEVYLTWEQLHRMLRKMLGTSRKQIAMQYSPRNNIPYVAFVDAGTVELIKSFGHRVVSSADLVQQFVSLVDEEGYRLHKEAGVLIDGIRAEAFGRIRDAVRTANGATEFDIQEFIMRRFREEGLTTYSPPMVGTNDHPADPHFDTSRENARSFHAGDTVLIDLWAKKDVPEGIYYDITWVGYIGETPPEKYVELFRTVRDARDAAIAFVQERFARGKKCYGWEVDDVCRNKVKKAGWGKYFVHRTGHAIDRDTHGTGVNIDNLETKDERVLMPGCCFSIEPGLYLEGEMAVRTEVNIFIRHDGVPEVTGEIQRDLVQII